ncbi:hypothetical protein B7P43_G02970 [Cryptotermes secundus]|uniref:Protein takeout n=1 Tax=Cryptotermes secundus TaxID=105785 RepID=A0A2J7PM17_9NEOP|nr:protein takeout [Cryptotermes secundus]PNF17371.1 hypothetical protein B7P43_G02970 [Cryptotermes secundus]PNF17373.1 hypothetical protein B7P43_G02970 [Cryptotermes secundus]
MKSALLFALVAVLTSEAAKLPSTIKLCRKKDPNMNECLRASIKNAIREMKSGLPEIQLIPVDPLFMTKVTIQDGAGRPVNINLELNNVKNSGFSESDIEAARIDFDKHIIEADVFLKFSKLEADYVMNGKFLVLPIKGNGKCIMEFTGLNTTLRLRAEPMTRNGKSYWNVVYFGININSLQDLKINFDNLFNGDKLLSDSTNLVLNENWKQFWAELKPSFEETYAEAFLQLSKTVFGKVAENDIFLD